MKYFVFALTIFVLLVTETGILAKFHILPIVPSLLVIFCAILVPLEDRRITIFSAVTSGIFLDFASGLPDGIHLLALGIACLVNFILIYWWLAKEYNIGILFVAVAATTLVYFVSVLVLTKLFTLLGLSGNVDYGYLIVHKLFWSLVLNLALTYPVYLLYLLVLNLSSNLEKKIH